MSLTILAKKWPSVKSALRPTPSAQAENEKSALFPGKRAEIYFPPRLRPFSGKKGGDFIFRPPEKFLKNRPPPIFFKKM